MQKMTAEFVTKAKGEIMRFEADTHSHTLASGHAYSTIKEMAAAAEAKGLKALALTEHAPKMPGTCGLFYFQNLDVVPRKCGGIRLLMGAEVNIMDETGRIDLPESTCRDLDIVIASIHPPCYGMGHTEEENMRVLSIVFPVPACPLIKYKCGILSSSKSINNSAKISSKEVLLISQFSIIECQPLE